MGLNDPNILMLIDLAIDEDLKNGDITTNSIISEDEIRSAEFLVKQNGIIAGLDIARFVMSKFDFKMNWNSIKNDGDFCTKDEVVAKVEANYKSLLSAERTALNFLQRMSGIATKTNKFVKQLEGLHTKILDTRKTAPGHRLLDKYAVKMGGGENHRTGLYDMVLIKDNHIKLAGSITKAVSSIKHNLKGSFKIEVETSSLKEVGEALETGVDIIMFDN
ncbi:MAG: carboxylating nicotinate-nucleotide diphosphorylase, partial [Ignavibacteria bacterium]|nr:carboxylating nicotinate-nucleotide diphosphorylase [Ignavibacteria bacterium]